MRIDLIKTFILWLLIIPLDTFAGELQDLQSWWNITATGSIYHGKEKTHFNYWLEGAQRFGDYLARSTQGLLRPGIGYTLNETTSVWIGAAWIETGVPLNHETIGERRTWQQLLWTKHYSHLILSSRFRLEQRFFNNNPVVAWRIRQQLKMISPLPNNPTWSFVGFNEVFFYHSHLEGHYVTGFDQNRFFMGMGYKINKASTVELGYLNQFISRHHNANFFANNIATNFLFKFN